MQIKKYAFLIHSNQERQGHSPAGKNALNASWNQEERHMRAGEEELNEEERKEKGNSINTSCDSEIKETAINVVDCHSSQNETGISAVLSKMLLDSQIWSTFSCHHENENSALLVDKRSLEPHLFTKRYWINYNCGYSWENFLEIHFKKSSVYKNVI